MVWFVGLMMELSTLEVGCLCQGSLQELDLNMAALEDLLDMEGNLLMADNNLLMVDSNSSNLSSSLSLVMVDNLGMEVKEDMDSMVFRIQAMDLDL